MSERELQELRERIDEVDTQIVELLNQRAEVVVRVGKLKTASNSAIYAPDREQQVFDKIRAANRGPLPDRCLMAIYRELMSGSLALENPQRVAYLGPEGSFSNLAAIKKFGACVEYHPVVDIGTVFQEVARGHADYGLVPIENSSSGGVVDTLDAFVEAAVTICAEIVLPIHHNLLALCPAEEVRKIYSKPEVFGQCRQWLGSAMSGIDLIPEASTARAAERAAPEPNAAAIGSTLAGELYGLKVVCANVEDNPNNVTRFFVIGREPARPTDSDKTALMFVTAHKAGALAEVLNVFAERGINLTNITSRPNKKHNWEYYFFADAEGHYQSDGMRRAIEEARQHCLQLEWLGSFPRAGEVL